MIFPILPTGELNWSSLSRLLKTTQVVIKAHSVPLHFCLLGVCGICDAQTWEGQDGGVTKHMLPSWSLHSFGEDRKIEKGGREERRKGGRQEGREEKSKGGNSLKSDVWPEENKTGICKHRIGMGEILNSKDNEWQQRRWPLTKNREKEPGTQGTGRRKFKLRDQQAKALRQKTTSFVSET